MIRRTRLGVLFLSVFILLSFASGPAEGAEILWVESIDIRELFGRITDAQASSFATHHYGEGNKKYSDMLQSGHTTSQMAAVAMRDFKRSLQNKDYDTAKTMLDAMWISAVGRANTEHADMIDNAREFFLGNSDFWKPPRRQKNSGGVNK